MIPISTMRGQGFAAGEMTVANLSFFLSKASNPFFSFSVADNGRLIPKVRLVRL
jgi:hypothetical protein